MMAEVTATLTTIRFGGPHLAMNYEIDHWGGAGARAGIKGMAGEASRWGSLEGGEPGQVLVPSCATTKAARWSRSNPTATGSCAPFKRLRGISRARA